MYVNESQEVSPWICLCGSSCLFLYEIIIPQRYPVHLNGELLKQLDYLVEIVLTFTMSFRM